jgi:Ubiquitin-conjugating enzyme
MRVDFSRVRIPYYNQEDIFNLIIIFLIVVAHLYFPKEYPLRPPRMKFVTEIWHPNIDANGDGMNKSNKSKKIGNRKIFLLSCSLHQYFT